MPRKANSIRIIGGKWKSRRINFVDASGLRPTTDRIRETLFNWLMGDIQDKVCLDMFAGSGALGFEALSRGATHVTFIDNNKHVIEQLIKTQELLHCDNSTIIEANFPQPLVFDKPFDLVFLDPPYDLNLISTCCEMLTQKNWLSDNALIYIEYSKRNTTPSLPESWELHKSKGYGNIMSELWQSQSKCGKIAPSLIDNS